MSLPDTIFIFALALVIFGPKKLPEIGRQLGKLVLEFRRASNEFKMQIEEELRTAELADRQKQIAAPPVTPAPATETSSELTIRPPSSGTTVSTESPSARVVPVQQEVAELEAVAGDHPELPQNGLHREPEQAVTHHD
jgi:sec-independent protein translocase protein TatB